MDHRVECVCLNKECTCSSAPHTQNRLLSPTESAKCVELCELYGFEDCGYPQNYRSNTRMITTDPGLSQVLYQRIKECCPATYECEGEQWEICGLNGIQICSYDLYFEFSYSSISHDQLCGVLCIFQSGLDGVNM